MNFPRNVALLSIMLAGMNLANADEGMWNVSELNSPLMQKMSQAGLKLNAEQIYSESSPSIKDAVIIFDNVGTGEFVSANGLIFTNHHCGRDRVQQVSTESHNYLRDGFWATSQAEEIPIKGMIVRVLLKKIDVTEKATEELKTKGIRKVSFEMEKPFNDTVKGIEASMDRYSNGTYVVSIYQVFRDIRLVGVPPESIGYFGGVTDNFEWPHQAGDFSIFRVYAGANNMPADYSKDNKPYKPKAFLPVSLSGVHENDFAMIVGFPYMTQRNISSYELQEEVNVKALATVLTKGQYITALQKEMDKDEGIRLKYTDKNFNAGNTYKFYLGILKNVNLSPAMETKKKEEADFRNWVNADTARISKYGKCLDILEKDYALEKDPEYAHALISGALFGDASLFGMHCRGIIKDLNNKDKKGLEKDTGSFRKWYEKFSKDYDSKTDQAVLRAMVKLLRKDLKKEYLPDFYSIVDTKYNGDIDKYIDDLYSKSTFSTPAGIEKFLKKPSLNIQKDPLYIYGISVFNKLEELNKATTKYEREIVKNNRIYQEGRREKETGILKYPDANFSMRISYGKVAGASPRDGITYKCLSTLKGVIEKEDSTNYDFIVPAKLKDLYFKQDYGRYGENGEMYVDFLTNNDIIGGNSGSPVMNGNGEITGLAFDTNVESLATNYIYEPEKNRTINVDIRYVLFVIDKFAHSSYILNELTIK